MCFFKKQKPPKPYEYNIRGYKTKNNKIRYYVQGMTWDGIDNFWCPYEISRQKKKGFKTPAKAEEWYSEYLEVKNKVEMFNQKPNYER